MMNGSWLRACATLFTLAIPTIAQPPAKPQDRPNILIIIADDLADWHMGGKDTPQHRYEFWYAWLSGGSDAYNDPVMGLNGQRVKEKGYTPEVWTRRGVNFTSERQSSPRPWFLVVSYPNPHTPYEGHPQRYYDLYKNTNFESIGFERKAPNVLREARLMDDPVGNLRKAAAATTALDDQIPPLLKALDETGQRSNAY